MYDEHHFTRDAATAQFNTDADGITRDDDGDVQINWDDVETVRIDDPPHATAFDSKEFYRIPATVAKPIPQPYQFGDDTVWLKKPREELKDAAWSLDNAPWTHGHPETGMVKNTDDVRGFWDDTRYIDGSDDLDSYLHVPVHDEESKEFIEDNGDVSVGFYNHIARVDEYDGVVGGSDDGSIDVEGYQTDMIFDHCASVAVGRCPSGKGCGIDSRPHGHVDTISDDEAFKGTVITAEHDTDEGTVNSSAAQFSMQETTDQPDGIHVADGTWFAVGPDEHPDESTEWADDAKFRVDTCDDVRDAWNLRGTGDIDIDESTLEARIKRVAESKDCPKEYKPWTGDTDVSPEAIADSAKRYSVCGSRKEIMQSQDSDCGCDTPTDNEDTDDSMVEISFDDLSTDAAFARLEDQHDGAAERLDELRDAKETADAATEAVDELDEIESVDELADAIAMLKEERDEARDKLDEARRPKMEEDAEFIAEHTDRFGETADDVLDELDEEPEAVADKRELVEDLVDSYDEQTANPSTDSGGSGGEERAHGAYASTPW